MLPWKIMLRSFLFCFLCIIWTYIVGIHRTARRPKKMQIPSFTPCQVKPLPLPLLLKKQKIMGRSRCDSWSCYSSMGGSCSSPASPWRSSLADTCLRWSPLLLQLLVPVLWSGLISSPSATHLRRPTTRPPCQRSFPLSHSFFKPHSVLNGCLKNRWCHIRQWQSWRTPRLPPKPRQQMTPATTTLPCSSWPSR